MSGVEIQHSALNPLKRIHELFHISSLILSLCYRRRKKEKKGVHFFMVEPCSLIRGTLNRSDSRSFGLESVAF
jgi:hypothetical protein